ncbi:hypothetical protein RUM44_001865 [Polyplax serrata]|uniref:K Homology domain-containing protein n=1 Tax=Polyplax serrata TaxID=468196 RepID=A0ABR1ALA3_POLSC
MSEFPSAGGQANVPQSTAYAAAVQRAREIAAKINPEGGGGGGVKRDLEDGFQPENKKVARTGGEFAGPGPQGGAQPRPAGMGFSNDGIFSEEIMVPDKIVGLIIGRGGEQITRLQSESGCKIQMERSRGTVERQCTLTGTREAIGRAREMVMNIVSTLIRNENFGSGGGSNNGESDAHPPFHQNQNSGPPGQAFAEIMVPGPKVGLIIGKGGETIKHLQDTTGARMVVVQDSNSQDYEKPLRITGTQQQVDHAKDLVYQMISDKDTGAGGGGAGDRRNRPDRGHFSGGPPGGQGNFNNDFDNNSQPGGGVIEILVPRAAVGVVIGKGGEMIKKIQSSTGAKLQFEQGRDDGPGDRKCILTGKPEQCEDAREKVMELIDSVQRRDDRREPGRGNRNDRNERDRRGPGGDFDRPGSRGDRWGGGRDRPERSEITFAVPANRAGFVIGKGGEKIKQINAQCGAYCEIDRKLSNVNPAEKVFVIRGTPEQIEEAKRLIIEYSGIEDYYGVGGGGSGGSGNNAHHQLPITSTAYPNQGGFHPQGWGGPNSNSYQWGGVVQSAAGDSNQSQVPINPVNGQADYTLQWVEYYRSIGMVREAEMIEQQAKNNKMMGNPNPAQPGPNSQSLGAPGSAQQPAGNPQANGAQQDYSAQWAEYYRSIGKVKEAEAIEAQIKAKAAGGMGAVNPQVAPQPSQQQPGQMIGGAPQQPPQFNQFGGFQQQSNTAAYYGGPGQGGPYGNYPGYAGGYGQAGSEN